MMERTILRRLAILGCCGAFLVLCSGCSRWFELMASPESSPARSIQRIAAREQLPLLLDRFRITRNGVPQNLSFETEQRLLGTLKEMGLFSRVASTETAHASHGEKIIRARVLFDEALDPHAVAAALKSMIISASLFLLAPVMPFDYDYAAHMTLELERWDGQIKHYESRSAGTVHFQLFGATPLMLDELKGHVTESCLTELMQQVAHDTDFYAARHVGTVSSRMALAETYADRKAMRAEPSNTRSRIPLHERDKCDYLQPQESFKELYSLYQYTPTATNDLGVPCRSRFSWFEAGPPDGPMP